VMASNGCRPSELIRDVINSKAVWSDPGIVKGYTT